MKVGRQFRQSGSADKRRGVVLVFFALLFFALLGLYSVVIDWGIVRTTQVQMQTSADVAALQGLSGRDAVLDQMAVSDLRRRQEAAIVAALVFDEDLDRGTGPDQFRLGAGPLISNGVVSTAEPAGGLLETEGAWIPGLETNVDQNFAHGDLVAGSFESIDSMDPSRLDWHTEGSDYGRLDFTPSDAASSPSANAFLARLRRTSANQPLDRLAGVSSAGPSLPYLFGLGSAALVPEDAEAYDPRRDGITVRALAIADAKPVMMAGLARPGLVGLAPLGPGLTSGALRWLSLDEASWIAVATNSTVVLDVATSGAVTGAATGFAAGEEPRVGAVVAGGAIQIASTGTAPMELDGLTYATLHTVDGTGSSFRIRGFVGLSVESASLEPGPILRLTVRKLGAIVAPRNASAVPALAFDRSFGPILPEAAGGLLAAVLAR